MRMKMGQSLSTPSVLSIDYETGDTGRFYLAVDINPDRKTDPGNLKHP